MRKIREIRKNQKIRENNWNEKEREGKRDSKINKWSLSECVSSQRAERQTFETKRKLERRRRRTKKGGQIDEKYLMENDNWRGKAGWKD